MFLKEIRKTVLLPTLRLFLVLSLGLLVAACNDGSSSGNTSAATHNGSVQEHSLVRDNERLNNDDTEKQQAEEYVETVRELLQERGAPHVKYSVVTREGETKILVYGSTYSHSRRGVEDHRSLLNLVLKTHDPPVEIMDKVDHQLVANRPKQ